MTKLKSSSSFFLVVKKNRDKIFLAETKCSSLDDIYQLMADRKFTAVSSWFRRKVNMFFLGDAKAAGLQLEPHCHLQADAGPDGEKRSEGCESDRLQQRASVCELRNL